MNVTAILLLYLVFLCHKLHFIFFYFLTDHITNQPTN